MTDREFTCRLIGETEWDEEWLPIVGCLYFSNLEYKFRTKPKLEPGFYKSNDPAYTDYYALTPDGQWVWLPVDVRIHGTEEPELIAEPACGTSELLPWTD